MLNKIVIQGRLTKDLTPRSMPNGKSTVGFSIACDRDYKDDNGDRVTDFVDCVAFGPTADFLCRYFGKGKMVLLEGRIQSRKFTNKDGIEKNVHEIYAEKVHFCDNKKDSDALAQKNDSFAKREIEKAAMDDMVNIDLNDIPF